MAKKAVKITGLQKINRNLNTQIKRIEGRTPAGLIHAGMLVMQSMEGNSPKIPIDTANLRSSQFMVTADSGQTDATFKGDKAGELQTNHASVVSSARATARSSRYPMLVLGFSANYAEEVHETEKNYKRPGSGAYFFEKALEREKDNILKAIKDETQIK